MYYFKVNLLLTTLSAHQIVTATPIAFPQGGSGAESCPAEALTEETWTKLKIDDFLTAASPNLTTNNVQGFASSLGAPNFFCGLDQFCNAGQSCLPVDLPAWYALVAIQNYNSYMNSLNTAVSFAGSIMALEMPAVVADFWPKPSDSTTSQKELLSLITLGLSVVPFTGPLSAAASAGKGVASFLSSQIKPAEQPDSFVQWSNVGVSISTAVKAYQAAVSTSLRNTLNAGIDDKTTGVNALLAGGAFLGVAQNFTQQDMQANIIDSMKLRAISLALQGQKAYIYRGIDGTECFNSNNDAYTTCAVIDRKIYQYYLRMGDEFQGGIATTIIDKYGIAPTTFLKGPSDCFDEHKVQLFTPEILPTDPTVPCIFNLPVCTFDAATFPGRTVQENCRLQGLDV